MKAKCKKCGDTIEVTRPKEFKSCKCGAINLDYGDEFYFRVGGNPEDFDGEVEDAPKLQELAGQEATIRLEKMLASGEVSNEANSKTTDLSYRPEQNTGIKVEDVIACAIELASLGHPLMLDRESLQKLNQAVSITATPMWNKLLKEIRDKNGDRSR